MVTPTLKTMTALAEVSDVSSPAEPSPHWRTNSRCDRGLNEWSPRRGGGGGGVTPFKA